MRSPSAFGNPPESFSYRSASLQFQHEPAVPPELGKGKRHFGTAGGQVACLYPCGRPRVKLPYCVFALGKAQTDFTAQRLSESFVIRAAIGNVDDVLTPICAAGSKGDSVLRFGCH